MPRSRTLPALTGLALAVGSLAVVTLVAAQAAAVPGADSTVFVNEIHYDNASGDVGELIEIANTTGADLTGWTVVLYNGSNGTSYRITSLAGTDRGPGPDLPSRRRPERFARRRGAR